ncbi:ROK family transcriptional regulator [Parasphingorhabdus pacifica]
MPRKSWQGTNLPRVGGYNRAVVLDAIRVHGGLSRVELAGKTGLTAQTMSNIVRGLIDEGLVEEDGHAPSTGGKRRVRLRIVPDTYSSVGLHLDPEGITGVLLDLSGRVRRRSRRRLPDGSSPAATTRALEQTIRRLVRRSGVDRERLLGIGLAVPGPLDNEHRRVLNPPNLAGWGEVPLAELVQDRAGLPVVMDNDATAAAIGERWSGGVDRTGSFVYVHLGSGVGLGVVLDDRVYRGISNNAGEIGHVRGGGTRACACGRRGCLEAYCSMRSIVAQWHGSDGARRAEVTPARSVSDDHEQICRLAAGGDGAALRLLRSAAGKLGVALASVISVLDVDQVVLGGPALRHVDGVFRAKVDEALRKHVWAPEVRPITVRSALIGEDAGAVGAASLVLDRTYSPRLATLLGT